MRIISAVQTFKSTVKAFSLITQRLFTAIGGIDTIPQIIFTFRWCLPVLRNGVHVICSVFYFLVLLNYYLHCEGL